MTCPDTMSAAINTFAVTNDGNMQSSRVISIKGYIWIDFVKGI
jgi:hypothetical protein